MNRVSSTKHFLLVSLYLLILAACGPSPDEYAFQTQEAANAIAANWTETPTPTRKAAANSTVALIPTDTSIPTLAPPLSLMPTLSDLGEFINRKPTPTPTLTPT
jgi:hypothetical protein